MIPVYDPILDRYANEISEDERAMALNSFRSHPGVPMMPDPTNVTRPIRTDRRGLPHAATEMTVQPRPQRQAPPATPAEPVEVRDIRDLRAASVNDLNRAYWSRGLPALPAPVKPRRPDAKPVEEMTWQEINDTLNDELPSSSRLCFEETGKGVLSLDRTSTKVDGDESGTLADVVADGHWLIDAYPEAFDDDADPELAQHVYDLWLEGEALQVRYGNAITHETHIAPEIRARIEWERFMAQCSDSTREGMRRNPDGTYAFYSLVGRRLSRDEFIERLNGYRADFMARNGLDRFPTAAQIDQRNAMRANPTVQAQLRKLARINEAVSKALLDFDSARAKAEDVDAETNRQVIDPPYIPELATFVYRIRRDDLANRPEYGTQAYQQWLDVTRSKGMAEQTEWVEAHADAPALMLKGRSNNVSDDPDTALWHQLRFVREGIDFVRRSTCATVALGTHPTK